MMPSGYLELFSAEAESLRQPIGEMAQDICNLSSSAAELARSLTWLPDQVTDQPFGDRCRRLATAIAPLLAGAAARPSDGASEDLRFLQANVLMLEEDLAQVCAAS